MNSPTTSQDTPASSVVPTSPAAPSGLAPNPLWLIAAAMALFFAIAAAFLAAG